MRVQVDTTALAGLSAELAATAAELARIAVAAQAIVAHPALGWAALRAPARAARAVGALEGALLGPHGLAALPAGYAALGAEAAVQAADLAAAEAGAGHVVNGAGAGHVVNGAAARAGQVVDGACAGAAAGGFDRVVDRAATGAVTRAGGAADAAAGAVVSLGLRGADLSIGAGRAMLDGLLPQGRGVVREVRVSPDEPAAGSSGDLAGLYRRIDGLAAGELEVRPVRGADGVVRYLVLLRGVERSLNPTVNTPGQAVKSSNRGADSHSRAVVEALRLAGVPPGAELMLVGHSQGGVTAMNVAGAAGYRVTHVVVAGAPIANKRPTSAKVLAIEHQGDLVPELDGVEEGANHQRTVYRFGADRRLSRAAAHHGLDRGYLPELAGPRIGADPEVAAYLATAAPYLLGQPAQPRRFRLEAGPMSGGWIGSRRPG